MTSKCKISILKLAYLSQTTFNHVLYSLCLRLPDTEAVFGKHDCRERKKRSEVKNDRNEGTYNETEIGTTLTHEHYRSSGLFDQVAAIGHFSRASFIK